MTDADFIKELERRWKVNESLLSSGQITQRKYEENKAFYKKIAQTIERNKEFDRLTAITTKGFITSLFRELKEYGLKALFTGTNEIRLFPQDFTARNE